MPWERTSCVSMAREVEFSPGHMPLKCLLMAGAQKALGLVTRNQAGLKGDLNLKEALLGLNASENTSVWVFTDFFLTPGGYFSAAVERAFRVFWELLFFSNASCPFACLSFRQKPPGKCYRQQERICKEQKGWELSQENTHSFCSLLFYSILVCFKGKMWGNELFEVWFWHRSFGEELSQTRTKYWYERALAKWDLGRTVVGRKGIFLSMKRGASCRRTKNDCSCVTGMTRHYVSIMWRRLTGQGNLLRSSPETICGTGLMELYCIMIFLSEISSASRVTWTSGFWGVNSGELYLIWELSLWNSQS